MYMYGNGNKKMLNIMILEILREDTDDDHHLTQQEVLHRLKERYDVDCDRRSVKNNIDYLRDMGYQIGTDKGYWLMEREFDDAELRMLIDSVLFSHNITQSEAKQLIMKLKKLSSRYFSTKVSHVCYLPELTHSDNRQIMYSLDALNDAISEKKKVRFLYESYGTDFELHPKRPEPAVVNPYQLVACNGRYYLIGNYDKYDDVIHFRIDRIASVEILDEKVRDMKTVKGLENGFNLPQHMAEHIYMFSGPSARIRLKASRTAMNDLIDWFGKDFRILRENDEEMIISVGCNEDAMFYWALQYGPSVEVLEPEGLRVRIRDAVAGMAEKYSEDRL
jgi:predicted DNA-binding transcriptional regulator YafY